MPGPAGDDSWPRGQSGRFGLHLSSFRYFPGSKTTTPARTETRMWAPSSPRTPATGHGLTGYRREWKDGALPRLGEDPGAQGGRGQGMGPSSSMVWLGHGGSRSRRCQRRPSMRKSLTMSGARLRTSQRSPQSSTRTEEAQDNATRARVWSWRPFLFGIFGAWF